MNANLLKSIGAVLAGFIVVIVLSIGTDFVLESLGLFPPQTEPAAYTAGMLTIALTYRCVYTVGGGYVTALLAPNRPIRHAMLLGLVGIIAGSIGVVMAWNLSPEHWYPISLVITALPCTWLGGKLRTKQ